MKIFIASLCFSTLAFGTSFYVRLPEGKAAPRASRPLNFGLKNSQIRALKIIGADFTGYHLVPVRALTSELRPFVAGVEDPTVPPPFLALEPDPETVGSWWHQKLGVQAAWEHATGKDVTIADCDAGYHVGETDLGNLLLDHAFDTADRDAPTKVDDGGFVGHGTSVVAIMSGVLDGQGVSGIAPHSKVVPLQNFNYDSRIDDIGKEEATAACVLRALTIPEVRIIVLENQTTNGSSETFAGTREAVRLALRAGVTIVSAAGNYYRELTEEAADDTGSIIVGALESDGTRASFSNHGSRVAIAAYGRSLRTLAGPGPRYADFGGTSGATPQVAATVALMLEVDPTLTPEAIKDILVSTREEATFDKPVGGRLKVDAAVGLTKERAAGKALMAQTAFWKQQDFRARLQRILR